MKNKVSIPLSLLLTIAGTYAASAQAQTRSSGAIKPPQVTTQTTPALRDPNWGIPSGTPKPSGPSGCFVSRGDGLPTQYICPGSAARTSTSDKTNNGAASGGTSSQSLCAPWLSGSIKVSPQVAQELSRSCFGLAANSSTQTPSGSPNVNAPKGYANSLASGTSSAYSPQASGAADSFGDTTTQAVDPEAFKAAGSDAVTTSMDALVNGSTAAAPSNRAEDSGSSASEMLRTAAEVAEESVDAIGGEIEASSQEIGKFIDNVKNSSVGKAVENFLSTEVEPDLSGALTDIGGVFIDLEKGLLDPGTALGVKAIIDQANDPNKFLNASERRQMCAIMPDTCPPSQANQPTQAAPQPKQP